MHRFLLSTLALLSVPALHAQAVEIYVTGSYLHATNVPTNYQGSPTIPAMSPYTRIRTFGPGGGVTFNFLNLPFVKLGVDGRGSPHAALGGLKLTAKPPIFHISPYLQGSIGYLNLLHNNANNQYAVAEVLGGVDVPLLPMLDFRVAEVGVGHAMDIVNSTKPTFITASSGLVVHF